MLRPAAQPARQQTRLTGIFLLAVTAGLTIIVAAVLRSWALAPADPIRAVDVKVDSRPRGASVMLDGRFAGMTPITLAGVERGQHYVRIERSGYLPFRRRVTVAEGFRKLHVELVPIPAGSIVVTSTPAGAEVLLDGEQQGRAPVTLEGVPSGPHTVQLRKTNREDYVQEVLVIPGEVTAVDATLEDRVEKFLLAAIASQPEKLSHYTDIGHYYFINGKTAKAVKYYRRGLELSAKPDAKHDEVKRLHKEIKKHMRWRSADERVNAHQFRIEMEKAFAEFNRLHDR